MKESTKSIISKARNYVEVFILGGIVTFVACVSLGKMSNDKENALKHEVEGQIILKALEDSIDSEDEA